MRKLPVCLFMFLLVPVYAAQIVNVEYIHNAIAQKWDITVPYNKSLTNPRVAANMKYLLTTIDVANEMLNGSQVTTYGSGQYATLVAADTIAVDTAVDTLIQQSNVYHLELAHYYEVAAYGVMKRDPSHLIMISAAGKFYVDWGDGTEEVIEKTTVGEQWFGHDYATDGTYTVRLGGRATAYSADEDQSTVILSGDADCPYLFGGEADGPNGRRCPIVLKSFSGCLGCVFPTLANGDQPRFISTFEIATMLEQTSIPETLFDGIHGVPVSNMFKETFFNTYAITSVPENLFAGLSGAPAKGLFDGTFAYAGLTSIPSGLFAGIRGAPAEGMFMYTFLSCALTDLPNNLFAGISGPAARDMFRGTFEYCRSLRSIPDNLFGDVSSGCIADDFTGMFRRCDSLTGESAKINGVYLYNLCPTTTSDTNGCYYGATKLTDYSSIPALWR